MPRQLDWFEGYDDYLPREIEAINYVFNEYQNNDVWLFFEADPNKGDGAACDGSGSGDGNNESGWCYPLKYKFKEQRLIQYIDYYTEYNENYGACTPPFYPAEQRYRTLTIGGIQSDWTTWREVKGLLRHCFDDIEIVNRVETRWMSLEGFLMNATYKEVLMFDRKQNLYVSEIDSFGNRYVIGNGGFVTHDDFLPAGSASSQVQVDPVPGQICGWMYGSKKLINGDYDIIIEEDRTILVSDDGSGRTKLPCDPNKPCKPEHFSTQFVFVIERYTPWKYQWADRWIQYCAKVYWNPENLGNNYTIELDTKSFTNLEYPPILTYLTEVPTEKHPLDEVDIDHLYTKAKRRFAEKRYVILNGSNAKQKYYLVGNPLKFSFVVDSITKVDVLKIEQQLSGKNLLYSEIGQIPTKVLNGQRILSKIYYATNNYWKDKINWKPPTRENFDEGNVTCKELTFPFEEAIEKIDDYLYALSVKPGEFRYSMPDSLRVLEIHEALNAQTYSIDEKGKARVANLGYYIERIGRILGISVNPDGSVRSIRQKKGIERGKDIPAGWNFGQWGTNKGGSKEGQEGGKPEEIRDGIVYENRCNKFIPDKFDKKKQVIDPGDFTLCENIPQLLDEILDDLDKALGWQELGAWAIPNADRSGKITYYEGLNALLTEIAYTDSKISQISSQELVSSLIVQAVAYEILRAFGQPIVPKSFPFDIGEKELARVPYPGLAADVPTQTVQTAWILENLSVVVGSLLKPKIEQDEKK